MECPIDYVLICRHGCQRIVTERPYGPRMGSGCDADLPNGRRCLGVLFYATETELHPKVP